jgi:hypothetical protein
MNKTKGAFGKRKKKMSKGMQLVFEKYNARECKNCSDGDCRDCHHWFCLLVKGGVIV